MKEINNKKIKLDELLKNKGLKITNARLVILEIISKSKIPLCAFNVCSELLKDRKNKNINEATVFRNLLLLEKIEILKKIDLRRESSYFEMNDDHHHHIVCTNCGAIEDFKENKDIEILLEKIIDKSIKFKKVKEHSLELFGVCKICN